MSFYLTHFKTKHFSRSVSLSLTTLLFTFCLYCKCKRREKPSEKKLKEKSGRLLAVTVFVYSLWQNIIKQIPETGDVCEKINFAFFSPFCANL